MQYNGGGGRGIKSEWQEEQAMAAKTIPHITALQAQAVANGFLSDHLPDRFTAD